MPGDFGCHGDIFAALWNLSAIERLTGGTDTGFVLCTVPTIVEFTTFICL